MLEKCGRRYFKKIKIKHFILKIMSSADLDNIISVAKYITDYFFSFFFSHTIVFHISYDRTCLFLSLFSVTAAYWYL